MGRRGSAKLRCRIYYSTGTVKTPCLLLGRVEAGLSRLLCRVFHMPLQVYIYGCVDATIDIKGKCKMVAIDGCKKTKV